MFRITFKILGLSLIFGLMISMIVWVQSILELIKVHDPLIALHYAVLHTSINPELRRAAWTALLDGFAPVVLFLGFAGDWANGSPRLIRGSSLVSADVLARRTRIRKKKAGQTMQVELAGVPLPPHCENTHILLVGSTGVGKSTAINQLVDQASKRGDRLIVIDPDGQACARFSKPGDRLLNPFDKRSQCWNIFNEVRSPYDFDRLSKSVVPDSPDPGTQQWHGYAQQLLAATMRVMLQTGDNTTEGLLKWLTTATSGELSEFLAGTSASGLFEPGAEKALASTRFILAHHLAPFQYVREGEFSLRGWLENENGNIYISWRHDMLDTLLPLLSSWADVLMASILTLPIDNPKKIWFILDELASLKRLNSLEAGLTKGRKNGLRVVAGVQSVSQLDDLYGEKKSATLRSCFKTVLVFGGANTDPTTAKNMSDGLGHAEIERVSVSTSQSNGGSTKSVSTSRHIEALVLPSEIMSLSPLEGFMKLSGNYPVARIKLTYVDYPIRIEAFIGRQ